MLKLAIGFLSGVLATLAAVYLIGDTAPHVQPIQTERSSASENPMPASPTTTTENHDVAQVQHRDASESTSPGSDSLPGSLATETDSTVPTPQDTNAESRVSGRPSNAARREYPPEISEMIENRVSKELQARYDNDGREESWATYMEGQLSAYFAQKPQLAQFNISLIDCRTSVCSVHVLGYGVDALTHWNTATADLVSQPWFEFNNMSMNRRNPAPDILAVVLILTKKAAG